MAKKIKFYKNNEDQCIGGIAIVPEGSALRIFVAWEWESPAKKGQFKFYKGRDLITEITLKTINEAMNKGEKVANDQAKEVFPYL